MADLYSAQTYRDDRTAPNEYLTGEDVVVKLILEEVIADSATVEIIHPAQGVIDGPSAATIPTTVATTNNTTSRLAQFVRTTSDLSSVIVGQYYFLDAEGFDGRMVKVTDVEEGRGFRIDEQLPQALPSGAELRETELSYNAGALDRARGYRARWMVTPSDGTDPICITTYFDVVFQPFQIPITKNDVKGVLAGVSGIMGDEWRDLIRGATLTIVAEFDKRGFAPDRVHDARPFTLPCAYYIAASLIEGHRINTREGLAYANQMWNRYQVSLDSAMSSARTWYNYNDDDDLRSEDEEGQRLYFWAVDRDFYIDDEDDS